ncbi:phenylalanine--tRNA ligase subunit beta [Faecalibacter rhinopitheci]|uniref:Phenylalanine--tRNA ligase beta subunit n=1 Tax=Faecalibacter rhinopitheci TaxID=2779678 RepID=A0A8J7FQW8_9FLAO|nr:phenylalanine--tRNA ligase subunit beta [Faecalibacter rhinopitheci]MBF0598154.1 phenylalanine--tRNA ligase subunit beta [Faecalibacter rhinopitheci]
MKISYNWLKTYIDTEVSLDEISAVLTNIGLEVEGVEKVGGAKEYLETVVVGKVLETQPHPNADKLKVTKIDLGDGQATQIVCGAPNVAAGQTVPVATIGTVFPGDFKIKKSKIRGEESFGMICSEVELGIGEDNSGILVLDDALVAGTPLATIFVEEEDHLIEIGLTPNRADAMSHFGVARDLYAAFKAREINGSFTSYNVEAYPTTDFGANPIAIEVADTEAAPRYAGVYLKNITVKESPDWLKNKLRTIGLSPINNVVDITNFILHDLGQPLHAFDADKIEGNKVTVQKLAEGTKFTTLDGVERTLKGHELMICNENGPMCMAGVFGGQDSGITETTKNVFLESAYFEPVTIRKGAKAHGLNTDASFRFERGIDPTITVDALKKAVLLLVELADAEIASNITDIYSTPIENFKFDLRLAKVKELLGVEIPEATIKTILAALDINILNENNGTLSIEVPSYRVDVQREVDIIEDILRIYGYDNIEIPSKFSFSYVPTTSIDPEKTEDFVARQLTAAGFNEAMNNSLTKKEYENIFFYPEGESVEMLNPLSADLAVMRRTLLNGLLENVAFNVNRRNTNVKLFEFGKIYRKLNSVYEEQRCLGIVLSGNYTSESWTGNLRKASFADLKGLVQQIFVRLKIEITAEKAANNDNYTDGIEIFNNEVSLGTIGVINKKLAKKIGVSQEVYFAQLNWDAILTLANEQKLTYKDISKFPSSRRDLALLLDTTVKYEELYLAARSVKTNLLKGINLFDVYEGDKLPAGKKSYALSFMIQDENKTLSDQEIDGVMNKLIKVYQTQFNAELR